MSDHVECDGNVWDGGGCYTCMVAGECLGLPKPERTWNGKCAYVGMNGQMTGFLSHLDFEGVDSGGAIMDYWGVCPRTGGAEHVGVRKEQGTVCQTCGMNKSVPVPAEQAELL